MIVLSPDLSAVTSKYMDRPFLLINSNTVRPPVSPVGLEYVGEALQSAEISVEVIDLSWEQDWHQALVTGLSRQEPLAVGITFRNTDDCSSISNRSFLPWLKDLVSAVKGQTSAPVILGGVGFSINPGPSMEFSEADYGIAGDGEEVAIILAQRLQQGQSIADLPNLVHRYKGRLVCNRRKTADLAKLPVPKRRLFDNPRYQAQGAMVGIETKRGCPERCIYCADPLAKGRSTRLRPPKAIVEEIRNLFQQGVSWYHLCDSEFNIPLSHAKEVCQAILDSGLGDQIKWYTYCSPLPFDSELARLMAKSGCAGINFGVDSLCDGQLKRLRRRHRLSHIENLVSTLRAEGLNFMFDLLLGGPGESEDTVRATADEAQRLDLPLIGVAVGVGIYPGTPLSKKIRAETAENALKPAVYISPALGDDPIGLVRQCLGSSPRFLLLAGPGEQGSYNYVDDVWLSRAIENGARGAYWDIIRGMRLPS